MQSIFPASFTQSGQRWFYFGLLWLLLCWQTGVLGMGKVVTPPVSASAQQKDKPSKATGNAEPLGEAEKEPKAQAQAQLESSMDNVKVIEMTLSTLRKEIDNSKKGAVLNRTTIKGGLDLISSQLKENHTVIDEIRSTVAARSISLDKLRNDLSDLKKNELSALRREINTNAVDIGSQKYLVENYAAGGYETLLKIADLAAKLDKLSHGQSAQKDSKQNERISMIKDLDRLWLLLAIVMVSFIPVAFATANNKEHNKPLLDGTSAQNGVVLVCLAAFLGYFVLGFGLMFGASTGGWLGSAGFVLMGKATDPALKSTFAFAEFLLYQANFVLLAALVIYTAIGRQLSGMAHLLLALFVGTLLVPVFGHWTWAGHFIIDNKGWLEAIGFVDAGGATTINTLAAGFALAWLCRLAKQRPLSNDLEHPENEPVYCASAVFFLGLSMAGFSAGGLSISSNQIATTLLNVGLAASAGGLSALLHYRYSRIDKGQVTRSLGGFATGLVAVSAAAPTLDFAEALVVGAIAGLIHNVAYNALRKSILQHAFQVRAAYLVAIHGAGGIWGSVCVALFGTEGLFAMPNIGQLGVQLTGTASALVYSAGLANAVFFLYLRYKK
jgi:Amt family ammonium transporter